MSTITVDQSGDNTSITAGGGATTLGSEATTEGIYQFILDTTNLANGDVLQIDIFEKVLTGSSASVVFNALYAHAQAEVIKISPPIMVKFGFTVKLTLTGTTRTFDWSIRRA